MNPSNENKLLLYCAQAEIPEATRDQVKKLIKLPLDWEEVLESSFWHGIAPLLYHNLSRIQESRLIPQEVMDKLKKTYYGSMARGMFLNAELSRILGEINEKGVEVIVLKGAALAGIVYGNVALRPMCDIDLLVKKEELPYAEKIMSELGYRYQNDKPVEWFRENDYHIRYIHPEKAIPVEIHWHIARESHPSRIAITDISVIERWWKRSQTVELSRKKVRTLCPDDLLLHLSLHFLKHHLQEGGFTSRGALIQLCDISQTLNHCGKEINWIRLRRETEMYGVSEVIYSTLCIVREFMRNDDGILYHAIDQFNPEAFDKELINLIQKRILKKEDALPSSLFQSIASNTFQKTLEYLLKGIFPGPEIMSRRYSIPLSSKKLLFYYIARPFSLLFKYHKLAWKILTSRKEIKEEVVLNKWINSKDQNVKIHKVSAA